MKNPKAPKTTTPDIVDDIKTDVGHGFSAKQMFVSAALSMSWQLAVVVLVPVIGGFELDKHLNISPWGLIIGFGVAIYGVVSVLRRVLQEVSPNSVPKDIKK